jgi:hypothetical protein
MYVFYQYTVFIVKKESVLFVMCLVLAYKKDYLLKN